MIEQTFTVAVYNEHGDRVYLRRERGYSAQGVMAQITQRRSDGQSDPPEPHAAWPVSAAEVAALSVGDDGACGCQLGRAAAAMPAPPDVLREATDG